MAALPIVETDDVGKDVGLCLLVGPVILEVNLFAFEGAKETPPSAQMLENKDDHRRRSSLFIKPQFRMRRSCLPPPVQPEGKAEQRQRLYRAPALKG